MQHGTTCTERANLDMSDPDNVVESEPPPPIIEALEFERLGPVLYILNVDVKGKDIAAISTTKPYAGFCLSLRFSAVVVDLTLFPTWIFERVQRR
jgi:hypothetical protein